MRSTEDTIAQQLLDARALELSLARTLEAHLAMTPAGRYRDVLAQHVRETQDHADRIARRLADLRRAPGTVETIRGLGERLVGQALALGTAPLDLVWGGSREEKLLRNAREECASEALEIATYDALEQLALLAGDARTAGLAADHRADEERMVAALRAHLPALAAAVVGAEPVAPDGERPGTRRSTRPAAAP